MSVRTFGHREPFGQRLAAESRAPGEIRPRDVHTAQRDDQPVTLVKQRELLGAQQFKLSRDGAQPREGIRATPPSIGEDLLSGRGCRLLRSLSTAGLSTSCGVLAHVTRFTQLPRDSARAVMVHSKCLRALLSLVFVMPAVLLPPTVSAGTLWGRSHRERWSFILPSASYATGSQSRRRMFSPVGASIPEIDDTPDLRNQDVPSQGARSRTGCGHVKV